MRHLPQRELYRFLQKSARSRSNTTSRAAGIPRGSEISARSLPRRHRCAARLSATRSETVNAGKLSFSHQHLSVGRTTVRLRATKGCKDEHRPPRASRSAVMPRISRNPAARRGGANFGKTTTLALHALHKLNPAQRLALLRTADDSLVKSICECALNTLEGNVALSRGQKSRLGRHRQTLRRLACNRGSWKTKKRIIVQRGNGFLTLLLAPILGTLVSSLISK